jgi:hypothetical protein
MAPSYTKNPARNGKMGGSSVDFAKIPFCVKKRVVRSEVWIELLGTG